MVRRFLKDKALSLIELSLSMLVVFLIAMAFLLSSKGTFTVTKKQRDDKDLRMLAISCQRYYQLQGHWPQSVSDLQGEFIDNVQQLAPLEFNDQGQYLILSSATYSLTIVRPRGVLARVDYFL